jgi:hypothetical protein
VLWGLEKELVEAGTRNIYQAELIARLHTVVMEELRLQNSHGNDESGYPAGTGVKNSHILNVHDDWRNCRPSESP